MPGPNIQTISSTMSAENVDYSHTKTPQLSAPEKSSKITISNHEEHEAPVPDDNHAHPPFWKNANLKDARRMPAKTTIDKNSNYTYKRGTLSPFKLNVVTEDRLFIHLLDTKGNVWQWQHPDRQDPRWDDESWIKQANEWYEATLSKYLGAARLKPSEEGEREIQWTVKEKSALLTLVKLRLLRKGEAYLGADDLKAVADQLSLAYEGTSIIRNETIISRRSWNTRKDFMALHTFARHHDSFMPQRSIIMIKNQLRKEEPKGMSVLLKRLLAEAQIEDRERQNAVKDYDKFDLTLEINDTDDEDESDDESASPQHVEQKWRMTLKRKIDEEVDRLQNDPQVMQLMQKRAKLRAESDFAESVVPKKSPRKLKWTVALSTPKKLRRANRLKEKPRVAYCPAESPDE